MRSLLALLTIPLLGIDLSACGAAGKGAGSVSRAPSIAVTTGVATRSAANSVPTSPYPPRDGDEDNDAPSGARHDSDDGPVLHFGHAADTADNAAITWLVKRYYAVAAASDGATACSLIYSILAESVPEEYGESPALRRGTCAAAMSKLFEQRHRELAAQAGRLAVTRVRVRDLHGLALLRFGTAPERRVLLRREGGAWKMGVLFDVGVP